MKETQIRERILAISDEIVLLKPDSKELADLIVEQEDLLQDLNELCRSNYYNKEKYIND